MDDDREDRRLPAPIRYPILAVVVPICLVVWAIDELVVSKVIGLVKWLRRKVKHG